MFKFIPNETVRETVETIVIAIFLAFVISFFIVQPNQVNGDSMLPNIRPNEYVLTNRVRKHIIWLSFLGAEYKRGEIVVFKLPDNEPFIKRVIGLPGDKVMIKDEQVYVNDKLLIETYLDDSVVTSAKSGGPFKDGIPAVVPEDHYVVFGDNRSISLDSRTRTVGFVHRKYIKGPVSFRVFPFGSQFGFIGIGEFEEIDIKE